MRVTTAMLADAAFTSEDQKLFIHGAGWDRIFAPIVPVTHPTMAVVLIIEVDYTEALIEHIAVVELTRKREPVGPRLEFGFKTGHPPQTERGEPAYVPFTFTFPVLNLAAFGTYEWVVTINDEVRTRLPMRLVPMMGASAKSS